MKKQATLDARICRMIEDVTGNPFAPQSRRALSGGCIHNASVIEGTNGHRFFVKRNTLGHAAAYAAEAHSLDKLAATQTLRVPLPIGVCSTEAEAALVLEFLPMGAKKPEGMRQLGSGLAKLHRHRGEAFGWDHDNWIGSMPQRNTWHSSWVTFYRECRLRTQWEWARKRGLSLSRMSALLDALPAFFSGYDPEPSLLHGDLWSGNASFHNDGSPVIFDPASYYGDRETDLAMTEMFGGFSPDFYAAYAAEWPLDAGYPLRKKLYLLYHELNHFNLFGGGYGAQARHSVDELLRAIA